MSEESRAFDPTRHLTKVSGRDYLEVKYRVVWFRSEHPDGSITTEMVQHQNSNAVFRATVSWPTDTGIVACSDYGSEGSDDFGDYLEKASTKAIGRALGLAGYGTAFCDDHAFGADKQRVVDSPVDIRPQNAPQARQLPDNRRHAHVAATSSEAPQNRPQEFNTGDTGHVTDNQEGYIRSLVRALDWSREDVERHLHEKYGVSRISELGSREDVSAFIGHLQTLKAANEPAPV